MKKLFIVVAAGSLMACASNPDPEYLSASDESDYGYYESKLGDNRYRVSFNGDTSTSSNAVKDMALLRASELTKLNDYDWFRVMERETTEVNTERRQVSTGVSTGTNVYRSCGLLGCTTTTSPAYSTIEIQSVPGRDSYSTTIEIVMGEGEVQDQTSVYNATELYAFLSDKY